MNAIEDGLENTDASFKTGGSMLTVKQVSQRLRVSASLVYSWCEDHLLPHYRMGGKGKGKILIEETALAEFLQSCKVDGKTVDASSLPLKHIKLA
jgi:excisionase family DNA binding protein